MSYDAFLSLTYVQVFGDVQKPLTQEGEQTARKRKIQRSFCYSNAQIHTNWAQRTRITSITTRATLHDGRRKKEKSPEQRTCRSWEQYNCPSHREDCKWLIDTRIILRSRKECNYWPWSQKDPVQPGWHVQTNGVAHNPWTHVWLHFAVTNNDAWWRHRFDQE